VPQDQRVTPPRVFLLSPARLGGERAQLLFSPRARFELARRFQERGATIGEVMTFASSLYFRGKVAYATAFARPPRGIPGAFAIVPGVGLLDIETPVTAPQVAQIARIDVSAHEAAFTGPLRDAAALLVGALGARGEAVLLGSIASDKYVPALLDVLGARLRFPPAFVGRGDMSRGALLLRAARAGVELETVPVAGAVRRGRRAPRLGAAVSSAHESNDRGRERDQDRDRMRAGDRLRTAAGAEQRGRADRAGGGARRRRGGATD